MYLVLCVLRLRSELDEKQASKSASSGRFGRESFRCGICDDSLGLGSVTRDDAVSQELVQCHDPGALLHCLGLCDIFQTHSAVRCHRSDLGNVPDSFLRNLLGLVDFG